MGKRRKKKREKIEMEIKKKTKEEHEEYKQKFVRGSLPPESLLCKYFEKIQERLKLENKPSEYKRGTFWIEPMPPFFALKENKQNGYLYRSWYFSWIPHHLNDNGLEVLRCTRLDCDSKLENKIKTPMHEESLT